MSQPIPVLDNPLQALRNAQIAPRMIEDYQPLTESLEWRLSELYWNTAGTRGFVQSEVPYTITSSGTLSANAARVLFANCREHPPEGPLEVLEIGSGTGLFARLFLDTFQRLCEESGKSFHRQLTYYVTDRSRQSIEQWRTLGVFEDLPAVTAFADARDPLQVTTVDGVRGLSQLRAVFCNYSLDSLPGSVLRNGESGPEELCLRTHLAPNPAASQPSLDQIRELVRSLDPSLIPMVSQFEFEAAFRPCSREYPYSSEALTFGHDWKRVVLNYGAIACLETVIGALDPAGFVLINDYGLTRTEDAASIGSTQRFGNSAALGLNFPFIGHHFAAQGVTVVQPDQDERLPIHPRLFCRNALPETKRTFHESFDFAAQQAQQGPQEQARQHIEAGRLDAAKQGYEQALAMRPRDWVLLGEIAEFLIRQVADYEAGRQVAAAALAVNPWYSVWLYNVYGDALYALNRFEEAHESYVKAQALEPADVRTSLNLGYTFAQAGNWQAALEALSRGLANDRGGLFRERLLEKQQQVLALLQARAASEQEWFARRAARIASV